jgi:hypothetical protein
MATLAVSATAECTQDRKLGGFCTQCGSEEIFRQRPLGLIERHLLRALRFVPYWCATCNTRSYLRVRRSRPISLRNNSAADCLCSIADQEIVWHV